jgi:segregation and condensation protein B
MISANISALLFLSTKPLSVRSISQSLQLKATDVEAELLTLAEKMNVPESGIHLAHTGDEWQLVTNPACADIAKLLVKDEAGELTRPSLEALTIIAYRGPISKPEIEAVRGVNCTLILRNLLMRGLVVERDDALKGMMVYTLSPEAMRYLGLHDVAELPGYADLHANAKIDKLLESLMAQTPSV